MPRRGSTSTASLVEILRHLENQAASAVHLRADRPPVFWKGNELLVDQGVFAAQSRDAIRRLICVPLTDDQIAEYRRKNFVSVPLGIPHLGAFDLEAYVQEGREELVIASAARRDPAALFRGHPDLLEEARRAPEDADVYWNLGVAFLDEGEYQLAWHALDKARALLPDDGAIWFQLGSLLGYHLHRVDEAIAALERASALPEPRPEVYSELAVMLRSSERLGDAELAVRRGLAVFPDHARLLEALGVICSSSTAHGTRSSCSSGASRPRPGSRYRATPRASAFGCRIATVHRKAARQASRVSLL